MWWLIVVCRAVLRLGLRCWEWRWHRRVGPWAAPFVYVTNQFQGFDVSQYDASSGVLSPLSPFTVAAGIQPAAIAVTPDAKSVYVANASGNTVTQYSINQTTGSSAPSFRSRWRLARAHPRSR